MVALGLFSCSDATSGSRPSPLPKTPQSSTKSVASSQPTTDETTMFVRTCDSSVYGDLGRGWRRGEISAGPVTFVGARGYARDPKRWFSARADLATSQKVLIVVDGEYPVVLSVRHPYAALAYDPDRWGLRNTVPFRLGYPLTRFEPCVDADQRSTQFNGGFLLRRWACVPVEVRLQGHAPISITLSFGAGDCT